MAEEEHRVLLQGRLALAGHARALENLPACVVIGAAFAINHELSNERDLTLLLNRLLRMQTEEPPEADLTERFLATLGISVIELDEEEPEEQPTNIEWLAAFVDNANDAIAPGAPRG